tara:strand:+ start:2706 stop:5375 length:2670 start_codon:yes stop_codon:yes gene_type:complete
MSDFIQFNQRAYKFIRGSAMNSVIDAFVELLTNADDAYDRGKIKNKLIHIDLDYDGRLSVTDQAIGLNAEDMKKCFLQIGNYTSKEENRGFFSRGAKDISGLGDVTFETIKDNKYSKVILDKDAKGKIVEANLLVDNKQRQKLNIKSNGLKVTIDLNDNIDIPVPKSILEHYVKNVSLRNILSNKNCKCTIAFKNSKHFEFNHNIFDLKYTFPLGEPILYLSYKLHTYDVEAFFSISKADKTLYDTKNNKYCDWGLLINSGKVIHDTTVINPQFKFNPHMKTLFGVIHCDYINKLLIDYDKNGASKKNPFPILDPSRVGGLNYDHPFMKELLKIPEDRLNLILQELEVDDDNEYVFYNKEINEIINKLNTTGDKFIESNDLMKFVENKNSNLIRGIESDRGKFVNVEKNFLHDLNKTKRVHFNKNEKKKNPNVYIDPMTKLFDIIGVGDEGNMATDQKDIAKLFKEYDNTVMDNTEYDQKQIFCYNSVEGVVSDVKTKEYESQNYQHLQKDNLFIIKFINSTQNRKYEIYQSGQKIILKINVNFPMLRRYFDNSSDFNKNYETYKLEATHYLHEIITEGLTRIQLMSYVNRDFIKIDNNSSSENFNELFKNYDHYKNTIDISVDKVIQSLISKERTKIQNLINNPKEDNNNLNRESEQSIDNLMIDSSEEENIEEFPIDFSGNENNKMDTGFDEKLEKNDDSNLNMMLIKDKLDNFAKENEKMKAELKQLKDEKEDIELDFEELKEILYENAEEKVLKNFKRIEKFFNYKFKTNENVSDFLRENNITHINISPALSNSINLDQYNLKSYENGNNTLFYGIYRDYDFNLLDNHKGKIFIYWHDNDANINYQNRRDNLLKYSEKAEVNICGSMIVEKYLQILNINYKKLVF